MVMSIYNVVGDMFDHFRDAFQKESRARLYDGQEVDDVVKDLKDWYRPPEVRTFLHDHFLQQYGSIPLGELHLHDLFTTMRTRSEGKGANGLVKVFFHIVTDGETIQAPEYSENHTVLFFLCALAALADREEKSVLPEYDPKKKIAPILETTALNAIERLFPERSAKKTILEKFKMVPKENDIVDFSKVISLIMDHYISETRRIASVLRNQLQGLSDKNDVRTYVISFFYFSFFPRPLFLNILHTHSN